VTDIGESVAVNAVADPEQAHWAQIEYTYGNGRPVQGYYTAQSSDGLYWSGTLNDQGQACLAGLPPGPVEFNLVPSDAEEAELKEVRGQIKTILDKIIADERAEAAAHDKELAQQSTLGRGISHYGAYAKGIWNGAVGLLTFTKDVVVKVGQAADLINPVSKLNNLLQASYTSYRNGDISSGKWRQSLIENYKDEEFQDLAALLGFDVRTLDAEKIRKIKELVTEAYEIVAFIATDPESLEMLTVFAKDYAGAQSSVEWAEFAGGGVFEIVLAALLLAFTGGLGNVAQGASKIRHAGWLRSLGGRFRRLGELLRHKRLNKKINVGVDSKKKVDVDLPEGKKLSEQGQTKDQKPNPPLRKPLTAAQIDEISKMDPHGIKAQRILVGDNGKVAVVGRSMGDLKNASRGGEAGVVDYARALRAEGYDTELFAGQQIKQEWFDEIAALRKEYGVDILPDEVIHQTTFYKENIKWAEKLRNENYTVIDIGNPNGKSELGPFYSGELDAIFGKAPANKVVDLSVKNGY